MTRIRRTPLMLALLLTIILLLAACGGDSDTEERAAAPTEAALSGDARNGEAIYSSTCFGCHGQSGEGVEGLGKPLTTSTFVAENNEDELVTFLKTGRPIGDPLNTSGIDMPPKGGNPALTDQELLDLVAFMVELQEE